jgi:pimeloyl-ACP methyl ester carboxylesterase
LEGLDLPKIFLAGHSMGGAIALWFAVQHPDLLHGVAIISSGAQLPVNLSLFENLASPNSYPAAVEDICRWSFSSKADPKVINGVRNQLLKTRPTALGADFRACDAFDFSGELGKISIPSLILVGDEDKMTPLRFSEGLRDGIPDAELEVIQGSGHMLPLEKPIEVAQRLKLFFKDVIKA